MAKRLRIPRLEPLGTRAVLRTHEAPRKHSNADSRTHAQRLVNEPWRKDGYGAKYRRNRQAVIERQKGRCADCGKVVATKHNGVWKSTKGGQVHHVKALCDGGSSSADNGVLLCPHCHALRDAARRRAQQGG